MPYEIKNDCVYKQGESEPLKCYDNHEDALAYLRALEANVEDVNKEFKMLSQAETSYNAAGGQVGKACSNCRWFMQMEAPCCHLVMGYPDPIEPNGLCNRWETAPAMEPSELAPIPVVIVEPEMEMDDMGKALDKPGVLERIWKGLQPYLTSAKADDAFTVFKGTDGKWHWHAIHTNNFKDLEDEILSEKAHEKYIARLDMQLTPMPELWGWHTELTKHGQADVVWYNEHFVHAVGHFDDTPLAEKAIAYYRKHKMKLSHGFTAPVWAFKDGVYDDYNTFEISTLPPYAAANPFTSFEEIEKMAMTDDKRRQLKEQFGLTDAQIDEYAAKDTERAKALEEVKVAYKDFADATPPVPSPTTPNEKALSSLYVELVEGQGELITLMKSQAAILKTKDNELATLKSQLVAQSNQFTKELNELRTLVNQPPRRASQDDSTTVVKDGDLKDALPTDDPVSKFFGIPLKAGE